MTAAATRTPDTEINPRDVIRADWDSEIPGAEPWEIVTTDKSGKETVHHSGHDLGLAVALGYHREAQRLHEHAAKFDSAEDEAREQQEFEAWKAERASRERAEFDGQRAAQPPQVNATPQNDAPQWENAG